MTTHRNLKPHYAEPKGKSGPVIVLKKGEVMNEPTTEAGKELLVRFRAKMTDHWMIPLVIAIEQEARANADRELRELLDLAYEMRDDECAGINYGCNSVQAFDAARAERKS
jgi:hypothetical protein